MDDLGDTKNNLNYTARNNIAYYWGSLDPNAALQWVEKQKGKDFVNRDSTYDELVRGWCLKDIAAASAYVREHLDDPAAETAASSVAENLFSHDPEDATTWIGRLPAGGPRTNAESSIATMWSEKDPTAASKWLGGLPENEKARVASIIARTWVDKNWPEASRWIDSLSGDARDEAVTAAMHREGGTPVESLQLGLSIKNDETRNYEISEAIRQWTWKDAGAAEAWVKNSPLSTEDQEQLLTVISDTQKAATETNAEK